MANKHIIELTDRELFNLWMVACWFERPVISGTLKCKLAALSTSDYRNKHNDLVEKNVAQQIVRLGKWLEEQTNGE